jgi:hypothetical protein
MEQELFDKFFSQNHDYELIYKNSNKNSLIKAGLMKFGTWSGHFGMSKILFKLKQVEEGYEDHFTECDHEMIIKYLITLYVENNNDWDKVKIQLDIDKEEQADDLPAFYPFYIDAFDYLKLVPLNES